MGEIKLLGSKKDVVAMIEVTSTITIEGTRLRIWGGIYLRLRTRHQWYHLNLGGATMSKVTSIQKRNFLESQFQQM